MSFHTDYQPPRTEIQFKQAEDGYKKIWVHEDHETVIHMVNDAETDDLITFSRVQGIGSHGVSFSTRPSNVLNVRDISV